jgi:hypothetical protein
MSVVVLVPWSGRCPHREAAWEWVARWYTESHPAWKVVRGEISGPWSKATAVAEALKQTDADILVIADGDCVAPDVGKAVFHVETGTKRWAIPHLRVHRLSQEATDRVLAGELPQDVVQTLDDYDQPPYRGMAGGGITVLRRETYLEAPMDHRFVGWGQEDQAWAIALKCLFGNPWRSQEGPLWHMWHPPQERMSREKGSLPSWDLYSSYRRVAANRTKMAELLDEPRRVAGQGPVNPARPVTP